MPVWNGETVAPFRKGESDDEFEINDSIPRELSEFLQTNNITKLFKVNLKKYANENYMGRPHTLGDFDGVVPTYLGIVSTHGPGYYSVDCEWKDEKGKTQNENVKLVLLGEYWEDVWKEAKEKKKNTEIVNAEHQTALEIAKSGKGLVPLDPMALGRRYVEDLRALGGGNQNGQETLLLGIMNMMMESSRQNNAMIIALMQGKGSENSMDKTLALVDTILGLKEKVAPRDRNVIEVFVEALAENADEIIGLFTKTGVERDLDPAFQQVREQAKPIADKAKVDPNFLKALVNHLDKVAGPVMADKVLEGFIRIKRPGKAPVAPIEEGKTP
jgi:hypothetical protein